MTRQFEDLVALVARLRSPEGCPWDREQTIPKLAPFVIEEAYEVVDAIEQNDPAGLQEEVGDLLFEAVFVAQIAAEDGAFTIHDSIAAVQDKLVRRHPHVFGEAEAGTADIVLKNWEKLKAEERERENKGLLSGVPRSLPAALKAQRLTEKAARVGFDWEQSSDVVAKIREELAELEQAVTGGNARAVQEELGDVLFSIVNLARHLGVEAEGALQRTNQKFIRRFDSVERALRESGRSFEGTTLAELDALWDQAKSAE